MTTQNLKYLKRFPVYNFQSDDDSGFGTFAEWLVADGKARGLQEGLCPSDEFDAAQLGAIWEVMLLVAAHEKLCNKFINVNGKSGFGHLEGDSFLKIPGKSGRCQ